MCFRFSFRLSDCDFLYESTAPTRSSKLYSQYSSFRLLSMAHISCCGILLAINFRFLLVAFVAYRAFADFGGRKKPSKYLPRPVASTISNVLFIIVELSNTLKFIGKIRGCATGHIYKPFVHCFQWANQSDQTRLGWKW
jgi:hypothetical protein